MKPSNLVAILLAGMSIGLTQPGAAAEPHDHHHETAPARLQLDQGRKWPTDAPLRQAMATMRADLAGKLHAIHKGSLSREGYAAVNDYGKYFAHPGWAAIK